MSRNTSKNNNLFKGQSIIATEDYSSLFFLNLKTKPKEKRKVSLKKLLDKVAVTAVG